MKTKILSIVFFSLFLMLSAGTNCFAQDEALYKKELSVASKQKNPSEYRAQAFKKYLEAINTTKMSESKLNQFVADKLEELVAIDFWSAYLVQTYPLPKFIKWREIRELLSVERVAAFKKLTEFCAANNCPKEFPADFPKPGSGWVRKDSGSSLANKPKDVTQSSTAMEFGNRAAEQFNQRKYSEVIQNASECLRLDKRIYECYYLRGLAYYATSKYDDAISDFTKYIEANPKDPKGFEFRAENYIEKSNYEAALADLNASLALVSNPEILKRRDQVRIEHFKRLAFDQLDQGKFDESIQSATECIRLNIKDDKCYEFRGHANFALGKYDAAISDFTQYIQLKPKDSNGFLLRGQIYEAKKNYDAAIADFTKALEIKYDKKTQERIDKVKFLKEKENKKPM